VTAADFFVRAVSRCEDGAFLDTSREGGLTVEDADRMKALCILSEEASETAEHEVLAYIHLRAAALEERRALREFNP
jgi:hypothetical protein